MLGNVHFHPLLLCKYSRRSHSQLIKYGSLVSGATLQTMTLYVPL